MGTVPIMLIHSILIAQQLTQLNIESRTLLNLLSPSQGEEFHSDERIVTQKFIVLQSKIIDPGGQVTFGKSIFSPSGVPISSVQEGICNDRWNTYETTYGSKMATQIINGKRFSKIMDSKQFVNPTVLWFWKKHPKIGETVTVEYLAQNTISIFKIKYKYENDESMTLCGRKVTLHKVIETPLSSKEGVFTVSWYDDKGMRVKRYHKTPNGEFNMNLVAWR